jgi:secreted trypsin-like serine protease
LFIIAVSISFQHQLKTKGRFEKDLIDGGPSCFGDSGGPLWKMVNNPYKGGTPTPVLIGVFSFMLWGTCIGRNEPGYYGRVSDHIEWIHRYVPKEEVCKYPSKFKESKLR